jgi:hypothetical protein
MRISDDDEKLKEEMIKVEISEEISEELAVITSNDSK